MTLKLNDVKKLPFTGQFYFNAKNHKIIIYNCK